MSRALSQKASEREVQIRLAGPQESTQIAQILRDAFATTESNYTPEAFAATTPDAETIRKRFDEGPIWVAVEKGAVVGTVSALLEPAWLYIRSMAVSPNAQGGGIGLRLLETVENFAVENGFKKLFLYTTHFLPGAIRLYEKNGFKRGPDTPPEDFFGTPGLSMEKKLD